MESLYHKFNKFLSVFVIVLFISSCSNDDSEIIENLPLDTLKKTEQLNVSYGSHEQQKYDIYLPKNRSKTSTKVFILIHGGAWVSGDKKDMNEMVNILLSQFPDYALVNINYRLASITANAFPMQIDDIKAVIEHLKQEQENYQTMNKYGFIGSSAGAHLSMLYSYKHDSSDDVQMVCSIVGPTNFTDINYTDNPEFANFIIPIQLITGVPFTSNPEYYEDLSPYHVVNNSAPATILFYGGQDDLIPTTQGVDMHDKLDELDVTNEFTFYENEGHGWEGDSAIDTKNKLAAFITTHF